ncbi:hypothetical protein RSOLAG1IB_06383 [Rhizoctonia solani AG-1 IB]|uniref:Uncharacterized protein n=1 Tax=Thanatephorus cucumeris (strain AG1-IB / isolate 7/3/14) TaxID=1108050 RepID=A0A0B7FBG3_THACB|nr:hypothetical protein RSOLAG1IB_06383 [Rhizoctonia solani AG-1 IB]
MVGRLGTNLLELYSLFHTATSNYVSEGDSPRNNFDFQPRLRTLSLDISVIPQSGCFPRPMRALRTPNTRYSFGGVVVKPMPRHPMISHTREKEHAPAKLTTPCQWNSHPPKSRQDCAVTAPHSVL